MHIAIFSDNFYPELSGISDSIIAIAKELAGRGHSIHFYAPHYSKKNYLHLNFPLEEINLGKHISITRFFSLPIPSPSGQGRLVLPLGWRTLEIKKFNPDIIHVHLPYGAGLEGLIASRLLKKPLVGTNHTPVREFATRYGPFRTERFADLALRYDTWFYNHCDFVSSPSQSIFDGMKGFNQNIPHRVVSNPLYVDIFKPQTNKKELKRKYGLADFSLLYAGRLAPEKKIDLVLKAFSSAKKKIPAMTLAITGKGPDEPRLRDLGRSLGVENSVKFLGFLKQEELPSIYAASDVFVIMSEAETQSIAAMQALLTEVPVIGASAWGLKEYLGKGGGILVEPGNVAELSKKLIYLAIHPEIRKKIGRKGRKFVINFSAPKIAGLWEKIYKKAIENYNVRK